MIFQSRKFVLFVREIFKSNKIIGIFKVSNFQISFIFSNFSKTISTKNTRIYKISLPINQGESWIWCWRCPMSSLIVQMNFRRRIGLYSSCLFSIFTKYFLMKKMGQLEDCRTRRNTSYYTMLCQVHIICICNLY